MIFECFYTLKKYVMQYLHLTDNPPHTHTNNNPTIPTVARWTLKGQTPDTEAFCSTMMRPLHKLKRNVLDFILSI